MADDAKICGQCGNNVGEQSIEPKVQEPVLTVKETKEVKEKKKMQLPRQKLAILAIGLILLIGGGVMAKDTIIYTISPEKYVLLSMNNTYKSISKDMEKMKTMFLSDISPRDSYTNTINISVDSLTTNDPWMDEELYMFNGSGLELSSSIDRAKKEVQVSGKSFYNKRDFVSINGRLNDDELLLHIPELYNKVFMLPSKDFGRRWNESDISRETFSHLDESLDISYSNLVGDTLDTEMDSKTKSAYDKALNTILSNARFEKNGSINLSIGDKSKKCAWTSLIIEENHIKTSLLQLVDALEEDNRLEKTREILRKTNQEYIISDLEDGLRELRYSIEEYFQLDKFNMDIYTYNGKVVKVDMNILPDIDYKEEKVKIMVDLLGENSFLDDFKFEVLVGEDGDKIVYTSRGNHLGQKNLLTDDSKLVVYGYGQEIIRLNSRTEIDLSKDKSNLDYSLDFNGDGMEFNFTTRGDFISTSDKIDYNFKDISVSTRDYYEYSFNFQGNLGLRLEKGAKNICDIDRIEKLKLLDVMGYDLYEIMSTIESNAYNIMY